MRQMMTIADEGGSNWHNTCTALQPKALLSWGWQDGKSAYFFAINAINGNSVLKVLAIKLCMAPHPPSIGQWSKRGPLSMVAFSSTLGWCKWIWVQKTTVHCIKPVPTLALHTKFLGRDWYLQIGEIWISALGPTLCQKWWPKQRWQQRR